MGCHWDTFIGIYRWKKIEIQKCNTYFPLQFSHTFFSCCIVLGGPYPDELKRSVISSQASFFFWMRRKSWLLSNITDFLSWISAISNARSFWVIYLVRIPALLSISTRTVSSLVNTCTMQRPPSNCPLKICKQIFNRRTYQLYPYS